MVPRRSIHSARMHDDIAVAPLAIGRVGVPTHHSRGREESGATTTNAEKWWVGRPNLQGRCGFTLVELLVSIAIALLLILGVNEVFKIGAQTVGAGQAFSSITRDERAAHFSFYTDVHNALTVSQPALIISSQCQFAFRNQAEAAAEPSGSAAILTVPGSPPTTVNESTLLPLLSSRDYRTDMLGFFAGGDLYQRQTASLNSFVSSTTSSNAWIWYGHLILPNNAQITGSATANVPWYTTPLPPPPPPQTAKADLFYPGATTSFNGRTPNDNNLYAAQWILGRMAMLLVPGATTSTNPADSNYISTVGISGNLLGSDATANDSPPSPIYSSRYDIVPLSISQFNTAQAAYQKANPASPTGFRNSMFFRYAANPFPVKPLNAANMAAVAPIFLNHCCHFVVEYAGDYLTQQPQYLPNSNVLNPQGGQVVTGGAQGDGTVDFVVDQSNDPTSTNGANGTQPTLWVSKIRWYGFPRDVNGDGAIDVVHDVVPLRDVLQAPVALGGAGATNAVPPWEIFLPNSTTLQPFPTPTYSGSGSYNYVGQMPNGVTYEASWGTESSWPVLNGAGSGLPRMLRITIALDDPAGRLAAPQTYEYVIDLGAQH